MTIKNYEIDVLNVKSADAIILHFFDENGKDYVVVIDAGKYEDGDTVSKFIKKQYNRREVDLAICSHCDEDHYGGFVAMLEEQHKKPYTGVKIKKFWINDPGNHVDKDEYKSCRIQKNVIKEARQVYTLDSGLNLIEMIDYMKIERHEAFSHEGAFYDDYDGKLEILGPTKDYYKSLVPKFRNELTPYDTTENDDANVSIDDKGNCVSITLDTTTDDASSHNQSSIVLLFKPDDGKKFLFMGDAGRAACDNMLSCDWEKAKDIHFLKVPHHESKHNMDSIMINHFNPVHSIVSTEKYGHYLSTAIKSALNKKNSSVYSTHYHGNLWYHDGTEYRKDYTTITPL